MLICSFTGRALCLLLTQPLWHVRVKGHTCITYKNACAHTPLQPLRESVLVHEHEKRADVCRGWCFCRRSNSSFLCCYPTLSVLCSSWLTAGMCWPTEHTRTVHPAGWHHAYFCRLDRTEANCDQTSAIPLSSQSLGSGISSRGGSRPGAGDISLMFIWLYNPPLASSFLPLSLQCWDMIWWEQKGVEHIDSAPTAVSLAPIHPLFLCPAIIPTLSLHLFLHLYLLLFLYLSLSLPPVCNHNNASLRHPGNKTRASLFPAHISLGEDKTNKGPA